MSSISNDVDETARLVFMDMGAPKKRPNLDKFAYYLRKEIPGLDLLTIGDLWGKYIGWDGRTRPTHSIETGERI